MDELVLVAADLNAVAPEEVNEFLETLIHIAREPEQVAVAFEVLVERLEGLLNALALVGLTAWLLGLSPAFDALLVGLSSDEEPDLTDVLQAVRDREVPTRIKIARHHIEVGLVSKAAIEIVEVFVDSVGERVAVAVIDELGARTSVIRDHLSSHQLHMT